MRTRLARHLLSIDALGGLAVGLPVLLLHDLLTRWYGLPERVVLGLAAANLVYGSMSGLLALTPRWRRPLPLTLLGLANVAWGGVCWWLVARHGASATWLGRASLVAEGTYVPLLGLVELACQRAIVATSDDRGTQWRVLECRVPPPIVALIGAAAMHTVARTWPAATPDPLRWTGGALGLAGLALALWAIMTFRRAATTIHPLAPHEASTLVITGPNRWTRNPMYVGLLLVLTGWGLWLGNAPALLVVPLVWGWLQRFQVQPEERALVARFGDGFVAYMGRVRRWL